VSGLGGWTYEVELLVKEAERGWWETTLQWLSMHVVLERVLQLPCRALCPLILACENA
jgi:hypothetical protein